MRSILFVGFIVVSAVFLIIGCDRNPAGPNDVSVVNDNVANDTGNNNEQFDAGGKFSESTIDALKSISLKVPFLPQVLPGDWNNTKNCGQTCAVMLGGYFRGSAVNANAITAANAWLAKTTGDKRYNDANGWYTGGNSLKYFQALLAKYNGLKQATAYGKKPEEMLEYVCAGKPCIVGVMIKGGKLVNAGGVAHWAIVVGWDGANVILNDPGTKSGNHIKYSRAAFDATWATQGRVYLVITK